MTRLIPLTHGMFAIVDDGDFDWLSQWKWHAHRSKSNVYAMRSPRSGRVRMHRLIAGVSGAEQVDHRNGDTLDNRRTNLRACSPAQNAANCRGRRGQSGFKGVKVRPSGRFAAQINARGRRFNLGTHSSAAEAAAAYDRAALAHHGEFARLNFPTEGDAFGP